MNVHVLIKVFLSFKFPAANITSVLWLFVNLKVLVFIVSHDYFAANGTRPIRFIVFLGLILPYYSAVRILNVIPQFN